jgi:hypothetical protein
MKNHTEDNNQDSDQKHENRNPVNTVHIADPTTCWLIRIPFSDIKVFSKLAKYSHLDVKDN